MSEKKLTDAVIRCHRKSAKCNNIYHISEIIMEEIVKLIECDSGFIALHENHNIHNTGLHFLALYTKNEHKKTNIDKMDVYHKDTQITEILKTKKPIIINNFNNDHLPKKHIKINNFMGFPLCDDTYIYGILCLARNKEFQNRDKSIVEEFLSMTSIILHRYYTSIYRYFFDISFDLTCISNLEGKFIRLNPVWEQVLGYTTNELYKMKYTDLIYEEDKHVISNLHLNDEIVDFESRFVSKKGEIKWLSWKSVTIKNKFVIISTVKDITDKKEAEIAAKEAFNNIKLALAETTNKKKNTNEYLSLIGHELKNPLNAILGFGQLLQFSEKLNQKDKKHVDLIVKSGVYLLNLINDIVDISKTSNKVLKINMDNICVNDVIEDTIELMMPIASERKIDINYDDAEKMFIYADEKRLKQSVINLISNAIKYNKIGGYIDITTKNNTISVKDSGIGISKDQQDKLFKPFKRLNKNKNIKGTGLGLVLTKKIVESMGGEVCVQSDLGKGSKFSICFKKSEVNKVKKKRHSSNKVLTCSLSL